MALLYYATQDVHMAVLLPNFLRAHHGNGGKQDSLQGSKVNKPFHGKPISLIVAHNFLTKPREAVLPPVSE